MLSAFSVFENGSCRLLLPRVPRGTRSGILALRLRRCFHHRSKASRPSIYSSPPRFATHAPCCLDISLRDFNGASSLRYATTQSLPALLSSDVVAHVQSLVARAAEPVDNPHAQNVVTDSQIPAHRDNDVQSTDPFTRALFAMRQGDTRKLLIRLIAVERMTREELQEAAVSIPRTTFSQFFYALDPLRVARDCDPIDDSHTPVGMFKMLDMESTIDYWGVRVLYTQLLQRLLILMRALKDAGHALHLEEFIALIRCAGACSDISGAGALWNEINATPAALAWRHSRVYTEYIKARFLTEPLYTNYQKTTRMVTPRNLHRSRLRLHSFPVQHLDGLRLVVRRKQLRFGLNKDIGHVEELMRALRGQGAALRLFRAVTAQHSFRMDEDLICTLMIALARSGSLRFIGTNILQVYFGIRTPHPFPEEPEGQWAQNIRLGPEAPRITPTVRFLRAVIETYGSNGEIAVAVQLVEYLSSTYNIHIPPDAWQDLLGWTHIMATPPASTAWAITQWYSKVPSSQAVEMIWNAMTSAPYNYTPTFQNYSVLISSLINQGHDDLTPIISRMREAIALYEEQCREYEAAALDHARHLRDGISVSTAVSRFERARFKKQRMWYTISVWCRMLLKRMPFSKVDPVPHPFIPDFVREFRPFLRNPVRYLTPTGRVSLVDPAIEKHKVIETGFIQQTLRMKDSWGEWREKRFSQPKIAILSSHSLADFKASKCMDPLNLLAPRPDVFKLPHSMLSPQAAS